MVLPPPMPEGAPLRPGGGAGVHGQVGPGLPEELPGVVSPPLAHQRGRGPRHERRRGGRAAPAAAARRARAGVPPGRDAGERRLQELQRLVAQAVHRVEVRALEQGDRIRRGPSPRRHPEQLGVEPQAHRRAQHELAPQRGGEEARGGLHAHRPAKLRQQRERLELPRGLPRGGGGQGPLGLLSGPGGVLSRGAGRGARAGARLPLRRGGAGAGARGAR
mmetsp:Transcript_80192/g.210607  ORF Transcript_80192/g.210607 Transcript_80192/m.210607 type:complete len:219 (-) Transcript_80192:109-765(-)